MKRILPVIVSKLIMISAHAIAQPLLPDVTLPQYSSQIIGQYTSTIPPDFLHANTISLSLSGDFSIEAELNFLEAHPAGSTCWVGKIRGQQWGYIILAETSGAIFGKAEMDDGSLFVITSNTSDRNILVQQMEASEDSESCHEEVIVNEPEQDGNSGSATPRDGRTICDPPICEAVNIDLLAFYTNQAMLNLGGTHEIVQSAIAMAVSEMNLINLNSEVDHMFVLVHTAKVDYEELGEYDIDLGYMRDPDDGIMDEVHAIRDKYYADLTTLIVGRDGCGFAYVNSDSIRFDAQTSFGIVRDNCMLSKKTLAHEFGHNLGFRHDRYAYLLNGGSLPNAVCGFSYGWTNPAAEFGDPQKAWHTVMAYDNQCDDWGVNCARIPYWSNPNVVYNGDPVGSAMGNPDQAGNAYIMERSACQVSRFRVPPDCDENCLLFQECELYNLSTDLGPGYATVIELRDDFPVLDEDVDRVELCIDYFGDNSHFDELFAIYDENLILIGNTVPAYDCDMPTRLCFDIPTDFYNGWIADGAIEIYLDPLSTSINPEYCRINRACAEILLHPEGGISATKEERKAFPNIAVFPNPVSDEATLTIESNGSGLMSIELYDIQGRSVKKIYQGRSLPGRQEYVIEAGDLNPGMYICRVSTDQTSVSSIIVLAK